MSPNRFFWERSINPFTTGNPFVGSKLLGFSIGRGSGALKGLSPQIEKPQKKRSGAPFIAARVFTALKTEIPHINPAKKATTCIAMPPRLSPPKETFYRLRLDHFGSRKWVEDLLCLAQKLFLR